MRRVVKSSLASSCTYVYTFTIMFINNGNNASPVVSCACRRVQPGGRELFQLAARQVSTAVVLVLLVCALQTHLLQPFSTISTMARPTVLVALFLVAICLAATFSGSQP